jgi:hypothetical protein
MREGYGVIVTRLGKPILTIERSMLSGQAELSDEDVGAIRDAGEHLIGFAGHGTFHCFICGSADGHAPDCQLADNKN